MALIGMAHWHLHSRRTDRHGSCTVRVPRSTLTHEPRHYPWTLVSSNELPSRPNHHSKGDIFSVFAFLFSFVYHWLVCHFTADLRLPVSVASPWAYKYLKSVERRSRCYVLVFAFETRVSSTARGVRDLVSKRGSETVSNHYEPGRNSRSCEALLPSCNF